MRYVKLKRLSVFFYIDALDSSFLTGKTTPFMSNLGAKNFYRPLENVLGYSFAIQASMLSGKYPDENNHWMPYFYSPDSSFMLYNVLNKIGLAMPLDKLPVLRYLTVRQFKQVKKIPGVQANNIPLKIINRFYQFPYYYMCDLPFYNQLSNNLRESDVSLKYIGPPEIRQNLYSRLLRYIAQSKNMNEVIIVYDDKLDFIGHRFGPKSTEYSQYVKAVDKVLSKVYLNLKGKFGDALNFMIFSDHGQSQLSQSFDIMSQIKAGNLHFAEDYVCFVDATITMFWVRDNHAKRTLENILGNLKIGTLVNETMREKYHLNFKNQNLCGDLIFVTNPGCTFFPNYFSPFKPMKGLHGYMPETPVQQAFLISDNFLDKRIRHVKDIKETLVRSALSW